MTQHEITTILSGDRGVPTIVVRDHGAWEQQVRDEKRRQADEEIKAMVAGIERGEQMRRLAPRPSLAEQQRSLARIEAESRERREGPARVAAMLDAEETLITAMMAQIPEPPPQPVRCGRPVSKAQLAYEAQQAAHQQAKTAAARCGHCMACRTGGAFPCLFR